MFLASVGSLPFVWSIADLFMTFLALMNLYAIIKLHKILSVVVLDYNKHRAKIIDPIFKKENFREYGDLDSW